MFITLACFILALLFVLWLSVRVEPSQGKHLTRQAKAFRLEAEQAIQECRIRQAVALAVIHTKTDMAGVISYKLQHGLRLSLAEQALCIAHDVAVTQHYGPAIWEVPTSKAEIERFCKTLAR